MNLQDIQDLMVKQREERFSKSNQLSLGELINELEKVDLKYDDKTYKSVEFDFGSAVPTDLDSWRGSYNELALGYRLSGYDNQDEHFAECKADKLLEHLKESIGKEYSGWKGGEFTMSENTPIWVANSGNSGNTSVVGVYDANYKIVIITQYCEF